MRKSFGVGFSCVFAVAALMGCASVSGPQLRTGASAVGPQREALFGAVRDYYSAASVEGMRRALAAAKEAAPSSALYNEIAADFAELDGRHGDEFDHLHDALLDPSNDAALLHLQKLAELSWTLDQRRKAEALFETLQKRHPSAEVRGSAAHLLSLSLERRGRLKEAEALGSSTGWSLPFSIVGTWDNEQGKGFDIAYPPEKRLDPSERYSGQRVEIGWRAEPVRTRRGFIDLYEQMYPDSWAVAYAAASFESTVEAECELRLTAADAVKVWVDGVLVFADREVSGWMFDSMVIPLTLEAGPHTVLIKSAQERGDWSLGARLTKPGGEPFGADTFKALPLGSVGAFKDGDAVSDAGALIERRLGELEGPPVRRMMHAVWWDEQLGLDTPGAKDAETLTAEVPDSLRARIALAKALWWNGERAQTSDLLDRLAEETEDELVDVALKRILFQRQNDLESSARDAAVKLAEKAPDRPGVWLALERSYAVENWSEDRCRVLKEADARWPRWPKIRGALADCLENLGYDREAVAIREELLEALPGSTSLLYQAYRQALKELDYEEALEYARRTVRVRPDRYGPRMRLAAVLRKMHRDEEARAELNKLIEMAPTAAPAFEVLAEMAYLDGDTDGAVALWRRALEREPDDEEVAHRLDYLAPAAAGPWADDVPSDEEIDAVIASRGAFEPSPGADVALLLDHEVSWLRSDGSAVSVVTFVMHALNVSGRDQITEHSARPGGTVRVLKAYSIDPDGQRKEASSIRDSTIRYRQLQVGSTVVVQYRIDTPPNDLIGDYYSSTWWFQSPGAQYILSEYVLWTPRAAEVSTYVSGEVETDESVEGDRLRRVWRARNTPVWVPEKHSPSAGEVAWHVMVSTVPTWDLFVEWEKALLYNAFRENPQVIALAEKLKENTEGKMERLERIQNHLAAEVSYQQDYENAIAGVKPHAAPMVLARGYGDCKDKSVLFITLARLLGIETRFALVRTRNLGPIRKEVPSQQFNHAIIYVPPQEGIAQGRFFDPTADALDVNVLRDDVQGTTAFVLDLEKEKFDWVEIPYQDPEMNFIVYDLAASLASDGSAQIRLIIELQGKLASVFRRLSRNAEQLEQVLQHVVHEVNPGAGLEKYEFVEKDDLFKPVKITVSFRSPSLARFEQGELRLVLPSDLHPENLFGLEQRRYDLALGVPTQMTWRQRIELPGDFVLKHLPEDYSLESDCMSFSRTVAGDGGVIRAEQTLKTHCERINASDYEDYRERVNALSRALEESVVMTKRKGGKGAGHKSAAASRSGKAE